MEITYPMNRFILDYSPNEIAKQLCDQHIVKMPLEEAQMLCTAVRVHAPDYAERHGLYKTAYKNHPCTIWCRESRPNFEYAVQLFKSMLEEYTNRYNKHHASGRHLNALTDAIDLMPEGDFTKHPQCFSGHDDCKTNEDWPIKAYRKFYAVDKLKFARYNKGRDMPRWLSMLQQQMIGTQWLEKHNLEENYLVM